MQPKLGILAGGGMLPVHLANACKAAGRDVFVLVIDGHGKTEDFAGIPHDSVRLGEAGRAFSLLRAQGVQDVVMAGPVRRPSLLELRPDWETARFFARIGFKALGDDGLLSAVIREFEDQGFHIVAVDDLVGDLMAPEGLWGRVVPDAQAETDIARGLAVAIGLGRLDVGQSVVVQQGIVLGVEAIEGTDALIRRAGALRRSGAGPVLVKIAKPGQERRADLPTIGPDTVKGAAEAGFSGIAVEAGSTIVVGLDAVIRIADAAGLFLTGRAWDKS